MKGAVYKAQFSSSVNTNYFCNFVVTLALLTHDSVTVTGTIVSKVRVYRDEWYRIGSDRGGSG